MYIAGEKQPWGDNILIKETSDPMVISINSTKLDIPKYWPKTHSLEILDQFHDCFMKSVALSWGHRCSKDYDLTLLHLERPSLSVCNRVILI